jgi:capsid protein
MIVADSKMIVAPSGRPAVLEAIENNWYEASQWSPNRSWVWYPVQDARKDLDRFTRHELSKNARYLYKNSPLIRGLVERIVTLIAGSGFHPVFKSSSVEWNAKAQAWWTRKSRNIHLGPRCTFSQYVRAIARARVIDGECFTIKTFDEASLEDRIQGVEADRVTNDSGSENKKINSVDGINLNAQGTPISYKLRGVDRSYAAQDVIHHFTPNRLMQYRGETLLAAAINTARDVDDILAFEKQCVKDASSKKDIIKTTTGELNQEAWRGLRYSQNFPTVFNLPADDRTKDDYYRIRFGSQPVVLKTGDEYTPYKPDRPGQAWQGFMEFLSNTICLSANLPPSVVLPIAIGGTDIRRDLEIAQRSIDPIQLDIACELDEIIEYFLFGEIADGELKGAPSDRAVDWHFPQRINVDRQMAQQDREDVRAGLMSVEEYHGRYGEDGDAYERTVIEEVKRRKERIISAGFTDLQEFVQVMSMDPKMFVNKPQPGDEA